MSKNIPFLNLEPQLKAVRSDINKAFNDVTKSSNFILGKNLSAFEKKYASFTGTQYCIGVGNGFDALALSLRTLEIGKGDEVIVPSNTCMPTWMAVAATGATIVPVEPDINTFNIDPSGVANAVTAWTKVILPVHLYGQACNMSAVMKISQHYEIPVVEDNAQAHGASFNKQITGSFGLINAHSFYPSKNLGAFGDGGAVTTNDQELAERIIRLRNYGGAQKSIAEEPGINSRLDELQAAILSVKLKKLNQWNKDRKKIAAFYKKELKNVGDICLPQTTAGSDHVYHLFVVRTSKRDALKDYLSKKGIQTMVHYPVPPHLQRAFAGYRFQQGQFPIAEEISNTCLSLPVWPGISASQLDYIASSIRAFFVER